MYLEHCLSSCLVERNHLCNCERGLHGKHSCDVTYLKFRPVVQAMSFKEKVNKDARRRRTKSDHNKSKKDAKHQEKIQSSTTPDPRYHMGK